MKLSSAIAKIEARAQGIVDQQLESIFNAIEQALPPDRYELALDAIIAQGDRDIQATGIASIVAAEVQLLLEALGGVLSADEMMAVKAAIAGLGHG